MGCPWAVRGVSMDYPRAVYGLSAGFCLVGISMVIDQKEYPWASRGPHMGCLSRGPCGCLPAVRGLSASCLWPMFPTGCTKIKNVANNHRNFSLAQLPTTHFFAVLLLYTLLLVQVIPRTSYFKRSFSPDSTKFHPASELLCRCAYPFRPDTPLQWNPVGGGADRVAIFNVDEALPSNKEFRRFTQGFSRIPQYIVRFPKSKRNSSSVWSYTLLTRFLTHSKSN